jgi:septal ring factor EnvC (AmiA/AmiB activator)
MLHSQQRALAQLQDERADKQTRTEALAQEQQTLQGRVEEMHTGNAELTTEIERYSALIEPAERALSELEAERAGLTADESEQRKQLQIEEQAHHRALLPCSVLAMSWNTCAARSSMTWGWWSWRKATRWTTSSRCRCARW